MDSDAFHSRGGHRRQNVVVVADLLHTEALAHMEEEGPGELHLDKVLRQTEIQVADKAFLAVVAVADTFEEEAVLGTDANHYSQDLHLDAEAAQMNNQPKEWVVVAVVASVAAFAWVAVHCVVDKERVGAIATQQRLVAAVAVVVVVVAAEEHQHFQVPKGSSKD